MIQMIIINIQVYMNSYRLMEYNRKPRSKPYVSQISRNIKGKINSINDTE